MDDDMKWIMILVIAFLGVPMISLAVSEWRKQDCRVELAKIGKTADEIKEICK